MAKRLQPAGRKVYEKLTDIKCYGTNKDGSARMASWGKPYFSGWDAKNKLQVEVHPTANPYEMRVVITSVSDGNS